MNNQIHPLCSECKFDEGQNFMIIDDIVYKLCNKHSDEYAEIYCNTCELFHLEPNVEEICAVAQRKFLDLDVSDDGSVNEDMDLSC
jgi:hypothetical protein